MTPREHAPISPSQQAPRIPAAIDVWRRPLLFAVPLTTVAFTLSLVLELSAHAALTLDAAAYGTLALGTLLLQIVLLTRARVPRPVALGLITASAAFFTVKLLHLLFWTAPGTDLIAELTESFFWVPTLILMSHFISDTNHGRRVTMSFVLAAVVASGAFAAQHVSDPAAHPTLLALAHLNLANLTLLSLVRSLAQVLERSVHAEARARTMHRAAHTDLLTGLGNRRELEAELARRLDGPGEARPFALLLIDLDGFRSINDALGHEAGDAVLRTTAARLAAAFSAPNVVVRLGSDEFVVLVDGATDKQAIAAATEAARALEQPVQLSAQLVPMTASIGISVCPHDGYDPQALLRRADGAMDHVKRHGKRGARRYDGQLDADLEFRRLLAHDLRSALQMGELHVEYQPIFDMKGGEMLRLEALVRWQHSGHGLIPPSTFIPLAEQHGLISDIGRWVLTEATQQAASWTETRRRPVHVAVNISPLQLVQLDFVPMLAATLRASGLPPWQLELELTEHRLLGRLHVARERLLELHQLGVRIAVDDFGSGYSSLSYLRDLPVSTIKIDRAFAADLDHPHRTPQYARALVQAILGISGALNLQVVAEGVETSAQHEMLCELGCHAAQGHLYARPTPAAAVTSLLLRRAPLDRESHAWQNRPN